jgi:hypothetical protein
LFYSAAAGGEANDNIINDTNGAVYFYLSNNGTANGNNVSKTVNYQALVAQNSSHVVFENNVVTRSGLELNTSAIWLCTSNDDKVENNTINEAPVGIQIDETSADGCSGSTGDYSHGNVYYSVGVDLQTLTSPGPSDGADTKARTLATPRQPALPRVSPSK